MKRALGDMYIRNYGYHLHGLPFAKSPLVNIHRLNDFFA